MKLFTRDGPGSDTLHEPRVFSETISLPPRSAWLFALFRSYARRYLMRHFHALRVSRTGSVPDFESGPLIIVANHPSWWDPLVGLVLSQFLHPRRIHYCPMDVNGLRQYPFLERLGFFPLEVGTAQGSLDFLRRSKAILSCPESVLWITAQGKFVDPRDRPVTLKQGIGHLAYRLSAATVVPLALEYPFWNDRCPEALVRFGQRISITGSRSETPRAWTDRMQQALEQTLEDLAVEGRQRDAAAFITVLGGSSGVGVIYDTWRRLSAGIRGESFHPEHGFGKAAFDHDTFTRDL